MGYGYLGYFAGFDHTQPTNGLFALNLIDKDINVSNYKGLEVDVIRFLNEMTRDPENKGIILDFSGVDYIDSSGVGLLVKASDYARKNGYCCALADVNDNVYKVLKLTAMTEEIFRDLIFKSVAEAYGLLKNYTPPRENEEEEESDG